MSRAVQRRRAIRWARYANHYAFDIGAVVGGWAFIRGMNRSGQSWKFVRRQAKRKYQSSEAS